MSAGAIIAIAIAPTGILMMQFKTLWGSLESLEPELRAYKVAQKRECFVACFGADKMLIQVKEFLLSCP